MIDLFILGLQILGYKDNANYGVIIINGQMKQNILYTIMKSPKILNVKIEKLKRKDLRVIKDL